MTVRRAEPGAIVRGVATTSREEIAYVTASRPPPRIRRHAVGSGLRVVWRREVGEPRPDGPLLRASDYLIGILLSCSLLLTLAGFVALHLRQAGAYGGPRGWTGFRAVVLGQTAMLASALASLAVGGLALGFLYVAGAFVLLVGLALLSVATYRAAILPHWSAYLVAALAATVFGEIGMTAVGLVWIALGYVLWSERGASASNRRS